MDVEKGAWFKVGINMQNNTDTDKIVYVEIEAVSYTHLIVRMMYVIPLFVLTVTA